MKQIIFIIMLCMILSLCACRRFRLDNLEIIEDPNKVIITIEKCLE